LAFHLKDIFDDAFGNENRFKYLMEWVHRVRLLIRNQIQLIRFVLPELQLIYFFFITHRIEILITIINETVQSSSHLAIMLKTNVRAC
jgi:hypothetical protein